MRRTRRIGPLPGLLLGPLLAVALLARPGFAQAIDESALPESVRQALSAPRPAEPVTAPLPGALADGPVDPATYRLGPGDELTVHYRGRTSATHRLTLSPEGQVYLPDVGNLPLAGLTLDDGRQAVRTAAARLLKNVSVDVELTRIRSFKVTVGGAVRRPGVYPATGATRVYEVLLLAGGPSDSAALRDIRFVDQVSGASVSVDLLPFLLTGRTGGSNPYLRDGASLFVPLRREWVSVDGAVLHAGLYDLPPGGTSVGDLLGLAGLRPEAAPDRIELTRFPDAGGAPVTVRGGLDSLAALPLSHGARVTVPHRSGWRRLDTVDLDGEVGFPGRYPLGPAPLRLRDLIARSGGVTPEGAPSRIVLVRDALSDTLTPDARRLPPAQGLVLTMSEREYLRARGVDGRRAMVVDLKADTTGGPFLMPGDRVIVPRRGAYVEVAGRVRRPGFYPHVPGAEARDYVEAAGGFADRADKKQTRVGVGPGDNFRTAEDAGSPEPGDQVWVPEQTPRSRWENIRDGILILGQLATIVILVDQLND